MQMENIGNFLSACESFGIKPTDLFQTVDLYEGTNIPQVIITYYILLHFHSHSTHTYVHTHTGGNWLIGFRTKGNCVFVALFIHY